MSIINNTTCPENTDSDDSEIEEVDEHVSMEEISSDSDEDKAKKSKTDAAKQSEANSKKAKEEKKCKLVILEVEKQILFFCIL